MADETATATETTSTNGTAASFTIDGAPDFRATLPEELRGEAALKDYKDVAGLAKSHVALQKLVGASIRIPKADDPPEVHAKYRAAQGVPDTPDKYEITKPEGLPAGIAWNDADVAAFKAVAHQAGLTPSQVKALLDFDTRRTLARHDGATSATAKQQQEAMAALEKRWGPKGTPTYQRNLGLANAVFQKHAPEHIRDAFDAKYGNDPVALEMFAALGELGLEDGSIEAGEYEVQSKESVQARIDAIRKDPKHPFNFPGTPGFEAAQAEMEKLYKQLYGTREVTA